MMNICPGKMRTRVARALLVNRLHIFGKHLFCYIYFMLTFDFCSYIKLSRTRKPGSLYAVKRIDSVFCQHKNILNFAYSQQVSWLFFLQKRNNPGNHLGHFALVFPYRYTAYGIPVKPKVSDKFGRFFTQIFINTALNGSVKRLIWFSQFGM